MRRLRRALLNLEAVHRPDLGPRVFEVDGGAEPHFVNLAPEGPLCDCADHLNRDSYCSHAACARLDETGMDYLGVCREMDARRAERLRRQAEFEAARSAEVAA